MWDLWIWLMGSKVFGLGFGLYGIGDGPPIVEYISRNQGRPLLFKRGCLTSFGLWSNHVHGRNLGLTYVDMAKNPTRIPWHIIFG